MGLSPLGWDCILSLQLCPEKHDQADTKLFSKLPSGQQVMPIAHAVRTAGPLHRCGLTWSHTVWVGRELPGCPVTFRHTLATRKQVLQVQWLLTSFLSHWVQQSQDLREMMSRTIACATVEGNRAHNGTNLAKLKTRSFRRQSI